VLHSFYPCGSVLAHYSGALRLHRGIAGGAGWYTFDWRGSGKSSAPAGVVSLSDLGDDIEAVAGVIGEPFDINAVNDGCATALAFAARRPEMVRRMLLIAPLGEQARSNEMAKLGAQAWTADPVMSLARELMWVHPGTDQAETFEVAKEAMAAKPVEVVLAIVEAAKVDLLELAPGVTAPALVLYTEGDAADALALTAALPGASAMNWTEIGDGVINGAAWRTAWDAAIPPVQRRAASANGTLPAGLSPREAEILGLVCRGLSNAEIAEALVIAPSTAKRHVANIFAKLDVASRPQAIALAHERGLVVPVKGGNPLR
jgi:DNA-binding CsgD family transcriptional regulator